MHANVIKAQRSNNICILYLVVILTMFIPCVSSAAEMLDDFEDESLYTSTNGYFEPYSGGDGGPRVQTVTVSNTLGANGTTHSMQTVVDDGGMYFHYFSQEGLKVFIPQAYGANRFSFYIKLPQAYPMAADNNLHFGTYTREPSNNNTSDIGTHFYHYLNIPGSDYWTKVICNRHPQHQVNVKSDPGNNPVSWEYYDGFVRFYIGTLGHDTLAPSWTAYVDEIKFYSVGEYENDDNINSIHCTYMGSNRFIIGWHGNSQYSHNGHRYEVRYSTSPITNANYSSTTVVSGSPFRLASGAYNFIKADFSITVQEGTRYYFAIKDIDSESTYVTKIDYLVPGQGSDTTPPASPTNVNVMIIN